MLDSGSGAHIGPDNDKHLLRNVGPSPLTCRVADKRVIPAKHRGTLKINDNTSYRELDVHTLTNCSGWLESIPKLLEVGHEFFLTNSGTSYQFTHAANGQRLASAIGRTSHNKDGTASGFLVNSYEVEDGVATKVPPPADPHQAAATLDSLAACLRNTDKPGTITVAANEPGDHPPGRFATYTGGDNRGDTASLLHSRCGHLSSTRIISWSRVANGFPPSDIVKRAAGAALKCEACRLVKQRRSKVPRSTPAPRSHKKGSSWAMDFTRDFPVADLDGHTCAIVFLERVSRYVRAYLLKCHGDFWDAAQHHVDWVAGMAGEEVRELQGDSDPLWAVAGDPDSPTVQCVEFKVKNQCIFTRSPPGTQAMNPIENPAFMGAVVAGAYTHMLHARVGQAMWGDALLHTCTVMNMSPIPGLVVPLNGDLPDPLQYDPSWVPGSDPRLAFTPTGILLGTVPDVSLLAAPLFSTAYFRIQDAKASQLAPVSKKGLLVGVAEGTLGWKIRDLQDLSFVVSAHVRFDADFTRRPALLDYRHHVLTGEGGVNSDDDLPAIMTKLYQNPVGSLDDAIIVFDPMTNRPYKLEYIDDPGYGNTLIAYDLPPSHPMTGRAVLDTGSRDDPVDERRGTVISGDGDVVVVSFTNGSTIALNVNGFGSGGTAGFVGPSSRYSWLSTDNHVLPASHGTVATRTFRHDPTPHSSRAGRSPRHELLSHARERPGPGGGRSTTNPDDSPTPRGAITSPLSYNGRNKIKRLPVDTELVVSPNNPKRAGSASHARYEKYKHATTVGEYLQHGSRNDLLWDFQRGLVNVSSSAAMSAMFSPVLSLSACYGVSAILTDAREESFDISYDPLLSVYRVDNDLYDTDDPQYSVTCALLRHAGVMAPRAPDHRTSLASFDLDDLDDTSGPPHTGTTAGSTWNQLCVHRPFHLASPVCAVGVTVDMSATIADNIIGLFSVLPTNKTDLLHNLLSKLDVPTDLQGMDARIARLGHVDEPGPDALDASVLYSMVSRPCKGLLTHEDANDQSHLTGPYTDCALVSVRMAASAKVPDPATFSQMLAHPHWATPEGYRDKYLDELLQLFDEYKVLHACTLKDVRADREAVRREGKGRQVVVIPMCLVAKAKYHADGTFHRYKVRATAAQTRGKYDLGDAWSPTVALDSARFLLSIAALNRAYISTYDVSGAYLNGTRDENDDIIYLRTPPGVQHVQDSLKARGLPPDDRFLPKTASGAIVAYKCVGNIYGLQQAGRIWYLCARKWLLGPRMQLCQSSVDPCIFYRRFPDDSFLLLALYVDDSLQVMSNTTVRDWYAAEFKLRFKQSPSSDGLCEFLGMTIDQSPERDVVRINCPHLWSRLDERLSNISLPARATAPLPSAAIYEIYADPTPDDNPLVGSEECDVRGILGQVAWGIYAARPAEAFAASLLARRASVPTRRYCRMLLHLCKYCLIHRDDTMTFRASERRGSFSTIVDSSWANDTLTHRSWFGYALVWAGAAFSFRSKLEPVVATSSRDAEAIAAVFAVKALLGFAIMLREFDMTPAGPLPLFVDNKATVDGAHSDRVARDSRHQGMRLAWLRDVVRSSIITLDHVTTDANLADIFTKILTGPVHARIRVQLMGGDMASPSSSAPAEEGTP